MSELRPISSTNTIPVFFACDEEFAGYLATALLSVFNHASPNYVYDIVILQDGMTSRTKRLLEQLSKGLDNCSIRFVSVSRLVGKYNAIQWKVPHFLSFASYYRLFIPLIASNYQKVVYLDCDVLLQSDIATLFTVEMGDNSLAGVIDPNCDLREDEELKSHLCGDFGFKDMNRYINTGVLLFNIEMMREKDMVHQCFSVASRNKGFYGDQDVLNVVCDDSVLHLDPRWNVFWGLTFERHKMRDYSDEKIKWLLEEPFIVHYAGEKPSDRPNAPWGAEWWALARTTPFYTSILKKMPARNRAFLPDIEPEFARARMHVKK
jgi:lipopolysaccharide biosynthesis glycosyltransferase